jgi:uncharacterized protein (TIGR03905 family)
MYSYQTEKTCSRLINFDIRDGIVHDVEFVGGCAGNTQGVARLVEGMTAERVIELLEGVQCGRRGTSCPDQLTKGLRAALEHEQG